MFIPSQYVPSMVSRKLTYDSEGRLRVEDRVNQGKWPAGMADANSTYPTDAERFDAIAPHIKANKEKDAPRRNYVIQPGGNIVYFDGGKNLHEAIYGTPSTAHIPQEKDSFGKALSERVPMATARSTGERLC